MSVPVRDASYNEKVVQLMIKLRQKGLVIVPWGKNKIGATGWNVISKEDGFPEARSCVQIGYNYAIRADDIVIVDVDAKEKNLDKATEDMYAFATKIRSIDTFQQTSQSGNPHAFFLKDERMNLWKKTNGISGFIDVMTGKNGAILGAGSTTDTGLYSIYKDMDLQRMPDWLFEKLNPVMNKEQTEEQKQERQQKRLEYEQTKDMGETERTIRNCLEHHSPNCDYDKWVKTGMIIKRELGDDSFYIWDDWSSKGDSYDPFIMEAKWNSFKEDGELGIGTLIKWAMEAGMPPLSPTTPLKYHFVEDEDDDVFLKDEAPAELCSASLTQSAPAEQTKEPPTEADEVSDATLSNEVQIDFESIKDMRDYEKIKSIFETRVCKIKDSVRFMYIHEDDVRIYNRTTLATAYENIKCKELIPTIRGLLEVDGSFIKKWCSDPKMREYEKACIVPPPLVCPKDTYNLWIPYPWERKKQLPQGGDTGSFHKLLKILCGNEDTAYIHTLKTFAYKLQFPSKKTGMMIIFVGPEGIGKNRLYEILKKVYGVDKCYLISSPQKELFGNFCTTWIDKQIVLMNDFNPSELKMDNAERMKGYITETEVTIEKKGIDAYASNQYAQFIAFSNQIAPVAINKGSRRYFMMHTGEKQTDEYYDSLIKWTEDDRNIYALYKELKEMDLNGFSPFKFPSTEVMEVVKQSNMSATEMFLADKKNEIMEIMQHQRKTEKGYWKVCERSDAERTVILHDDLYRLFEEWAMRVQISYKIHKRKFQAEMYKHSQDKTFGLEYVVDKKNSERTIWIVDNTKWIVSKEDSEE